MKTLLLTAALAAGLLISGCKDSPPSDGAKAAAVPVSISAIEAEASGFTLGSSISARTVYVFFDPQCPHCAALWNAAKPLRTQAKFIWVPVALMKPTKTSETQGAALLASKNPVSAMDEHEASLSAGKGGITAEGDIEAQRAVVLKNTALMNRFGFTSIPTIVGQHAKTGVLVTRQGGLPTPELAKLLGLDVPAN